MSEVLTFSLTGVRLTRAGLYVLLFATGLLISSAYTGTNLLFLMDFVLYAALILGLFFAYQASRASLVLELGSRSCEGGRLPLNLKIKNMPACRGHLIFSGDRFLDSLRMQADFEFDESRLHTDCAELSKRGRIRLHEVECVLTFPLDLVVLKCKRALHAEFLVHPRPESNCIPPALKGSGAGGDDGLRPHHPSDGLNRIHWKRFARDDKLYTRQGSSPKSQPMYTIEYDWTNELPVIRGMTAFFLQKQQNQEAFQIRSRDALFDSRGRSTRDLLDFMASSEAVLG